jgi:hypothetical protein
MAITPENVVREAATTPVSPHDIGSLRQFFSPLFAGTGGIDSWLGPETPEEAVVRLAALDTDPLPLSQLNQLLVLSCEAGVTEAFFQYYWLQAPEEHPYDVRRVDGFENEFLSTDVIRSLSHLKWGLYRFYTDALLYFGDVRSAYRFLHDLESSRLKSFFHDLRIDTAAMKRRGPALPLQPITKDNRYLVSEMACKSFGPTQSDDHPELYSALVDALHARTSEDGVTTFRDLLSGEHVTSRYADRQQQLVFSADDLLDQEVVDEADLRSKYEVVERTFTDARDAALKNTRLYLSMIGELDVYVATSMRTRKDFREMGDFCDYVFAFPKLRQLHLRYFDPTLSAAEGHEDKGLIECLMVKSAKALVYSAGTKESFGKDAEAAMALSLGKPVIFYCDDDQRERFYRDVHPLSRLIDFKSGVPVGAIVTSKRDDVRELLVRIFENRMEYQIDQEKPGHLRLREKITGSVVRLQTSDDLLRETFSNYYHSSPRAPEERVPGVGAPRDNTQAAL